MSARKQLFLFLGSAYGLIYRVPLLGEPAVRGISRALGFMGSHVPYGLRRRDSMAHLRQDLEKVLNRMDMDIEAIREDEDRIELILTSCPYGFRRPEQAGVCDAAMDLDRTMFSYCGYDLSIEACIPHGDPACRVSIHKKT
jgi:hypothetical protein